MKHTLTAIILATVAVTAQASDIALSCSYKGVDGSAQNQLVQLSPTTNGASIGNQQYNLRAFGNSYVLVGRLGDEITINRESLSYKMEVFGRVINGSCEIAKNNNKI